jgi:uncharacterized protein (TIGR02421 family)
MPANANKPEFSWERLRNRVADRLARNLPIDMRLPAGGQLRIDRQVPFLLVYRIPSQADAGTADLVTTESAYLIAPGAHEFAGETDRLCRTILATLKQQFEIVVLLEVWAVDEAPVDHNPVELTPAFDVKIQAADAGASEVMLKGLQQVSLGGGPARVSIAVQPSLAPPGLAPLSTLSDQNEKAPIPTGRCITIGVAVRPLYRNSGSGEVYPLVLQRLRRRLSVALRQCIFELTGMNCLSPPVHAESLGPSRMHRSADRVDRQLCEFSASLDFLLQVSPVNSEQAWSEFQSSGCRTLPRLFYRPLPYRPSLLKRKLFAIRIEHVDDSTLAWLFAQKQVELDRQITALRDIGTPGFRYSSLQMFGRPDQELIELAESILSASQPDAEPATESTVRLDATALALRAQSEIEAYRREQPAFEARVQISEGITAGIMVSGDQLLISPSLRVDPQRADSLLQHEIGTHLLTYFNGRSQPLRVLANGLAHCEALQEGLAVLAEYLSGGLSTQRLRVLAARVMAVEAMLGEVPFQETFRRLVGQFGLPPHVAFTTALRAYRGGGLTKDVVYLRGLQRLLSYLGRDQTLEPLYVGKVALQHVPLIRELRNRGIVRAPLLLPRFWNTEHFRRRLDGCRRKTVRELLTESLHTPRDSSTGVVA